MPLPWEQPHRAANLKTLGRLRRGDHLSVLKEGQNTDADNYDYALGNRGLRDEFKIQHQITQSFVRSKKGESILVDEQYLIPLTNLFAAAVTAWSRNENGITGALIKNAVRGLENLRQTYTGERRAKMDEILDQVRRLVGGIRVAGVFFDPGDHQTIRGEEQFPGMRERIIELVPLGFNDTNMQQELAVDAQFLNAAFGRNLAPQIPTILPIAGGPYYRRRASGVCKQFDTDSNRELASLNGRFIKCNPRDIRSLHEFLGRDDGLLFAVSQIATQSCIPGIPTFLFNMGGRERNRNVALIQTGDHWIIPGQDQQNPYERGNTRCDITRSGEWILISNEQKFNGNSQALDQHDTPHRLSDFGIRELRIRIEIRTRRPPLSERIVWELHDFMLRITTA